jgi:tetratricopeptide (TPR) repeat protein
MASTYHQLGMVAQGRGDLAAAETWYRKSLEIKEALGNRPGMASTYRQLGMVAQYRGEVAEAEALHRKALSNFDDPSEGVGLDDKSRRRSSASFFVRRISEYKALGQETNAITMIRHLVNMLAVAVTEKDAASLAYEILHELDRHEEKEPAHWQFAMLRCINAGLVRRNVTQESRTIIEDAVPASELLSDIANTHNDRDYDELLATAWRVTADTFRTARRSAAGERAGITQRQYEEEVDSYSKAATHFSDISVRQFNDQKPLLAVQSGLEAVRCLERSGAWAHALQYAQKIYHTLQSFTKERKINHNDDQRPKAELFVEMAGLMRQLGDYERAANRLHDAQRAYRKAKDPHGEGKALLEEAVLYLQQGATADAKRILVAAAKKLEGSSELIRRLDELEHLAQASEMGTQLHQRPWLQNFLTALRRANRA